MRPDTIHASGQLVPGANQSGYIPILDGWRAVAIGLVLVYHSLLHADLAGYPYLIRLAAILDHLGPFGVLIFFTISGYLITGRLIADHKKTGRFNLGEFYYKRAFRILPLSYFYLLTIALLGVFHIIALTKSDWAASIFCANYVRGRSWYTDHFWSLSVEEHFYLMWPTAIALANWRRAFWIGVTAILAVAIWRPWMLHHAVDKPSVLQRTDMRLDFLMVGSVVAIAVSEWPIIVRFLEKAGSVLGSLCVCVGLGLTLAPWPFDTRTLQALMLAALVCGTALSRSALVRRILANRVALFIGQISYSIYILQQPFFARSSSPFLNSPIVEFCKVLLVVGLASLSYTFLERPFIRFARQRIRQKEAMEMQERLESPV
jgi:peptidoglycan/LPS O-acetylase OafA/YrhL